MWYRTDREDTIPGEWKKNVKDLRDIKHKTFSGNSKKFNEMYKEEKVTDLESWLK